MGASLFDPAARKQTVSLALNSDLYDKTRALGIDISQVTEAALAEALHDRQATQVRSEIQRDVTALAEYVAVHGDPSAELREMFDASDAA